MSLVVNCKSQNTQYWNRNSLTVAYFEDIKKYPTLTIEEERKLLEIYKNGDKLSKERALHKLVECNQRFVVSAARRWSTQENLMDIVNEANMGLIKAINCFDLDKKQRLITYAVFWMRKYINEYLCSTEKIIRPINAHKVYTYVNKIDNRFFAENGRKPYPEEIQDILEKEYNIKLSYIDDIAKFTVSSIDNKVSNNDDGDSPTIGDIGSYAIMTSENNINEKIENDNNKEIVKSALSILKSRDRDIIKSYYGIECDEETLDVIAQKHNLSRERCRQIINGVIEKLRKKLILKNIK